MKKKSKKRIGVLIGVLILFVICLALVIGVIWLRFNNSEFRYNFDIIFNCDDTHYSYVVPEKGTVVKVSLPLPFSTTIAFKHSDSAVTYYSKLSYEEFLEYYVTEGYIVEENLIYTEEGVFIISDVNEEMGEKWKYNFIDIDLLKQ